MSRQGQRVGSDQKGKWDVLEDTKGVEESEQAESNTEQIEVCTRPAQQRMARND
jgi:hypothetical protein